jgi:hypothetical protein
MKRVRFINCIIILVVAAGCAPLDEIYSHEFSSGYYRLKAPDTNSEKVYLNMNEDTLTVFPLTDNVKSGRIDLSQSKSHQISSLRPGSDLHNSTFIRTSVDIDLSTVLLKYRPSKVDVPSQLNSNINGVFYTGFRKDYFKIKSNLSKINDIKTFIRHTGFDFGLFAGIGISPINPTVTGNNISQEYDGIVFQKGFSAFATYENMSVGFAVGFDNLLDNNKSIWIYNNKPWFGIMLGIANF